MLLEVIATTLTEAVAASRGGADRIELITGFSEGGLTPSLGLIEEVTDAVSIPVYVMVRPHSRSFCYDAQDVRTMVSDIRIVRSTNTVGLVVGALTQEGTIDVDTMQRLLDVADGMPVTFHRAFDEVRDQMEAIETLMAIDGVERVLTSGGKPSVFDAADQVTRLLHHTRDSQITIMAGSGVKLEGLEAFVRQTRVSEIHVGSGVRRDGRVDGVIESDKIQAMKHLFPKAPS